MWEGDHKWSLSVQNDSMESNNERMHQTPGMSIGKQYEGYQFFSKDAKRRGLTGT